MERYGTHCEQTYRTNFNRGRAKCIDWVKFNLALCRRYLNMDGLLAIAIDPSYISKSGKKTPHIGTFWSGCASSMKHGLEIMGLALVDVYANSCMMLRAHQTPSTGELKLRNMTLVQHYIAVIKRYKKELLKVTDIVVADAFFSIRPFVDGIKECGFHLVSRFRDTASLYYVYTGPRSHKPGRPKTLDGKINYKKLDLTRMAELHCLHTHCLFKGFEEESAPCHLDYAQRKAQAFLLHKAHDDWRGSAQDLQIQIPDRVLLSRCKAVCWTDALPGKAHASAGLLLQRIILCTERGEGHDEGERAAIFHGLI